MLSKKNKETLAVIPFYPNWISAAEISKRLGLDNNHGRGRIASLPTDAMICESDDGLYCRVRYEEL